MAKISRQEVLAIARISNLEVQTDEIDALIEQMEHVLSYAERVKEVATDIQESSGNNSNVFREDSAHANDPEVILQRAPEREGDYFVVPLILEGNDDRAGSIGGTL